MRQPVVDTAWLSDTLRKSGMERERAEGVTRAFGKELSEHGAVQSDLDSGSRACTRSSRRSTQSSTSASGCSRPCSRRSSASCSVPPVAPQRPCRRHSSRSTSRRRQRLRTPRTQTPQPPRLGKPLPSQPSPIRPIRRGDPCGRPFWKRASCKNGTGQARPLQALVGIVREFETGPNRPRRSRAQIQDGIRRGDPCGRLFWNRASCKNGTGQARPLQLPVDDSGPAAAVSVRAPTSDSLAHGGMRRRGCWRRPRPSRPAWRRRPR